MQLSVGRFFVRKCSLCTNTARVLRCIVFLIAGIVTIDVLSPSPSPLANTSCSLTLTTVNVNGLSGNTSKCLVLVLVCVYVFGGRHSFVYLIMGVVGSPGYMWFGSFIHPLRLPFSAKKCCRYHTESCGESTALRSETYLVVSRYLLSPGKY
jgi:hypothetical protein